MLSLSRQKLTFNQSKVPGLAQFDGKILSFDVAFKKDTKLWCLIETNKALTVFLLIRPGDIGDKLGNKGDFDFIGSNACLAERSAVTAQKQ